MVQWFSPWRTMKGPICDSPPFVEIHSVELEYRPPIRSILSPCWAELCQRLLDLVSAILVQLFSLSLYFYMERG